MASNGNGSGVVTVYGNNGAALLEPSKQSKSSTFSVKVGLAQMLRGDVIMGIITPEQARIAEEAGPAPSWCWRPGACPRRHPHTGRRSAHVRPGPHPRHQACRHHPIIAKARIGYFVEARILEAIGDDYVDESEVLTPAGCWRSTPRNA